jgi:hypothetical protein
MYLTALVRPILRALTQIRNEASVPILLGTIRGFILLQYWKWALLTMCT